MDLPVGTYNVSYAKDMAIIRTPWQWVIAVAALILLLLAPQYVSSYGLGLLNNIAILVVATLGMQILTGYAGQVSVGHAAFVGVGAYSYVILVTNLGLPFWLGIVGGGLVAGVVGLVCGTPSLRMKGFYLVMATIAAHEIIIYAIGHWPSLTGGLGGVRAPDIVVFGQHLDNDRSYFYLVMAVLVLATYAAKNLVRTRIGRAFVAVRDNDLAASVMGINVFYVKLQAFFIGCFFAGIAGALYAPWVKYITPGLFPLMDGFWYVAFTIFGGAGTIAGAFFGVTLVVLLKEALSLAVTSFRPELATAVSSITDIVFGVVLALVLIFQPRGIAHGWSLFKAYYRLWPLAR